MIVNQIAAPSPTSLTQMTAAEPPLPTDREPCRPAMRQDGAGAEPRGRVEALTGWPRVYPGL